MCFSLSVFSQHKTFKAKVALSEKVLERITIDNTFVEITTALRGRFTIL